MRPKQLGGKLTPKLKEDYSRSPQWKGDKFYNYVNSEVPESMVCDLGYEFRGYQYWHAYTNEQIESLGLLIKHVKKTYPNYFHDFEKINKVGIISIF